MSDEMPSVENDAGGFLTDRDRDEIARATRWAADEGCSEVFTVVERVVASHVSRATRHVSPSGGDHA